MSTQLVRTIGRAKVTIAVSGCVDCGTETSDRWIEDRRHQIIIGSRREYITLHRCSRCSASDRNGGQETYEAPTALQRRFEVTR